MFSRKLYATGSATANNVANVIVPRRSKLILVQWAVKFDIDADNGRIVLEISLSSATEVGVNAAQLCISECCASNNFVTSGMSNSGVNFQSIIPGVQFEAGQACYLHAGLVSGTAVYTGGAILWFQ